MKIALAQINPTVGDVSENVQKIIRFLRNAKEQKAGLVVFPEMSITGYPPKDLLLKKSFIAENKKCLDMIAAECRGISAIVGFVDYDKDYLYNGFSVVKL